MALLQIRVDEILKDDASALFKALGLDLSTAVRMFLLKSVLQGGLPFEANLSKSTLDAFLAMRHMQIISEQNGNSNMTLDEINEEIRLARLERKKKAEGKQ